MRDKERKLKKSRDSGLTSKLALASSGLCLLATLYLGLSKNPKQKEPSLYTAIATLGFAVLYKVERKNSLEYKKESYWDF